MRTLKVKEAVHREYNSATRTRLLQRMLFRGGDIMDDERLPVLHWAGLSTGLGCGQRAGPSQAVERVVHNCEAPGGQPVFVGAFIFHHIA